ncbi:MAG: pseudouridine synthase [Clostridiaceae bacterium]|jgi:23S rRNA pseudouridine2605 synthase|nr:pseudouridine synthase [Clostridiaceae bacterium]
MNERLQKYLARCGIASRRKCEEYILSGKVKVNGTVVTELGVKVDGLNDIVQFNNKAVKPEEKKIYIALNKPTGYVSTVKDEKNRKTILDLVKVEERIYPIGRLDYDTSGLILLTNDGELYNKIIHPREEKNKVYIAEIVGIPTVEELIKFRSGIIIDNYKTAPSKINIFKIGKGTCTVEIVIHEGKNRQIRKMCDSIKHPVISLRRLEVAGIKLGNLQEGKWRYLTVDEIIHLKSYK